MWGSFLLGEYRAACAVALLQLWVFVAGGVELESLARVVRSRSLGRRLSMSMRVIVKVFVERYFLQDPWRWLILAHTKFCDHSLFFPCAFFVRIGFSLIQNTKYKKNVGYFFAELLHNTLLCIFSVKTLCSKGGSWLLIFDVQNMESGIFTKLAFFSHTILEFYFNSHGFMLLEVVMTGIWIVLNFVFFGQHCLAYFLTCTLLRRLR